MKRIEAIIRPDKVADVCAALEAIGQRLVTISSVEGRGGGQEWVRHVRSASYRDNSRERSKIEIAVRDEDAGGIVDAIRNAAATGGAGDGNIFVHDLAEAIGIGTSESGVAALS